MASFFADLWRFLLSHKRYWLLPIVIVASMLGTLALLSDSSPVAPFIYTLF